MAGLAALSTVWPLAFGFGPTELIIILVIVIILFGASRIPSLMRSIGQGAVEFKKGMHDAKKVASDTPEDKKELPAPEDKKEDKPSEEEKTKSEGS